MNSVAYPLRIPRELVGVAKLRASEEYVDQATALRQMLRKGAEEYVLELLKEGRISVGKAAELLNESIYHVTLAAKKRGVQLGATMEQEAKAAETARKLLK